MTIFTQTFLPFVGGHFMALTLLSAWHYKEIIKDELLIAGLKQHDRKRVSSICWAVTSYAF
jgi:hypothetical protein